MKFKRTYTAAHVELASEWDTIEAIAEDALEEGLPITGIDSVLLAKEAFDAAGRDLAEGTIKDYCLVAKFDSESSSKQRKVFHRYGMTTIRVLAAAGWSQEAAYDLLIGSRKTRDEVKVAVAKTRSRSGPPAPLSERWEQWVKDANAVMMRGSVLAAETDDAEVELSGHAQFAYLIFQRINERKIDAELRDLLENAEL